MANGWNLAGASVDDVFNAAVAIEQGGFDFYERLRSGQPDPRVRKEFEFLRDEEGRHRELFLSFLGSRPDGARGASAARLEALVQQEFIGPLSTLLRSSRIETNEQTIVFGQELEKRSISFYTALLSAVGENRRADIERILKEEERHLEQLRLLLSYF